MDKLRLKDLENLLGIYPPFAIKDIKIDNENEICHVEIDEQKHKSKLSIRSRIKSEASDSKLNWRHIRFGRYQINIEFKSSKEHFQRLTQHLIPPFLGQYDSSYTTQVVNAVLLGHNKNLDAATIAELTGFNQDTIKHIIVSSENDKLDNKNSDLLPLETDPVWIKLIKRELQLKTRSNPLRMLLHKLELNQMNSDNPAQLQEAITILRTFFIKNKAQLKSEYQQIGARQPAAKAPAKKSSLKPDHPVWHSILTGEVSIISSNLAFNLYLSRLKGLYKDELPAADKREIVLDVMRYIKKHMASLKPELISIMRLSQTLDSKKQSIDIPEADQPIWRDIINGQHALNSNRINLSLLLVKLKVQQNKDGIDQCTEELRKFFIDNQNTLKSEIQQINQIVREAV